MHELETEEYFKNFFDESDKINGFDYLREEEVNGESRVFQYCLTKEEVLGELLKMPVTIQDRIRDKMVCIDFRNGDMQHFINYVLKGHYNFQIDAFIKDVGGCK